MDDITKILENLPAIVTAIGGAASAFAGGRSAAKKTEAEVAKLAKGVRRLDHRMELVETVVGLRKNLRSPNAAQPTPEQVQRLVDAENGIDPPDTDEEDTDPDVIVDGGKKP